MSRRRHPVWKTLAVMAADLCAIAAGLAFAYWLRFFSNVLDVTKGFRPSDYLRALPWVSVMWFIALRLENLYRRRSNILDFNVIRRIATGSILALLMFFAFAFYERREPQYSRLLIPIVFCSVVTCLIAERILLHILFERLARRHGAGLTRTAILGGGELAARVYSILKNNPEHGMNPIGLVTDPMRGPNGEAVAGLPLLGEIGALGEILDRHRIEEVILAQPELERERIPSILVLCEQHLADFHIVPDTAELMMSGMAVETVQGIPLLSARDTPLQGWNAALKRLVDIAFALAVIVPVIPLWLVLAWLIRREDGGPVFFVQERMGLDRRRFRICKFRTMKVGAEDETGPVFAEENDPRCTRTGAVLRKYRLDELPQILNILRGEMSLVGPRPERPYFVEQFRGDVPRYMARHRVRSGITGWAQIHGLCGKNGSIPERLQYDLYYVENWSLWLDFKILFITFVRAARAA